MTSSAALISRSARSGSVSAIATARRAALVQVDQDQIL
jgi:hypothetical protein